MNIGLCTIKMEEKSFFMKIAIKKPESITLIQFALNAIKKMIVLEHELKGCFTDDSRFENIWCRI